MPGRFHDVCYLGLVADGIGPVTASDDALDATVLAGRDLEIHAFTTPGEAGAFVAGVGVHAGNPVRVRAGREAIAHLAVLERFDGAPEGRIALVDHGGARPQQEANRWSWLESLARAHSRRGRPGGPTLWFQRGHGDIPPVLKIDHQHFTVAQEPGTLVLTRTLAADPDEVRRALAGKATGDGVAVGVEAETVSIRIDRDHVAGAVDTLATIVQILHRCAFEAERRREHEATRRDRVHCRVVEMMLQGWSLTNSQGRGTLAPPPGSGHAVRTIGYAMLDRLIDSGLIRPPAGREMRGHRQWNAVYEIGDLAGSDVRRPEDGARAARSRRRRTG